MSIDVVAYHIGNTVSVSGTATDTARPHLHIGTVHIQADSEGAQELCAKVADWAREVFAWEQKEEK